MAPCGSNYFWLDPTKDSGWKPRLGLKFAPELEVENAQSGRAPSRALPLVTTPLKSPAEPRNLGS